LESCRRIFFEIDTAEQELASTKKAPLGLLRVSLPMVGTLLMPVISRFLVAYPQITLDLDFTDKLVNVIEDGFDVVVRTGEKHRFSPHGTHIEHFFAPAGCSAGYLKRAGTPTHPEDLMHHACLHHKFPSSANLSSGIGVNG